MTSQRKHGVLRQWGMLLSLGSLLLTGCTIGSSQPISKGTATPTSTIVVGNPSPTATRTIGPTATATPIIDWTTLESKPLHLPTLMPGAACPVTPSRQNVSPDRQYVVGQGPAYIVSQIPITSIAFDDPGPLDPGSPWKISKVFWQLPATLTGPAIVRGRELGGTQTVMFNGGLGQTTENPQGTEPILSDLRLSGNGQWNTYTTFVRIQVVGCYAFQTDSLNATDVIVIQATAN